MKNTVNARSAHLSLIGNRDEQQDTCNALSWETPAGFASLTMVADGHGFDGAYFAVGAIIDVSSFVDRNGIPQAVQQLGEGTLIQERDYAARSGGTTLTVAHVENRKVTVAWLGDSEARLLKKNGRWQTLTIPHVFGVHRGETARLVREEADISCVDGTIWCGDGPRPSKGRISKDGCLLAITRAIGDVQFRPQILNKAEIISCELTDDDAFLVVASDGFWNCLSRQRRRKTFGKLIAESDSAENAIACLENKLVFSRLHDNTTVAIIDLR